MEDKTTKDNVVGKTVVDWATRGSVLKILIELWRFKGRIKQQQHKDKNRTLRLKSMTSSRLYKGCEDPLSDQSLPELGKVSVCLRKVLVKLYTQGTNRFCLMVQ